MRSPKDVNARDIIKVLERYGYVVIRQEGSHIRIGKTESGKIHKVTIPNHNPMKIGTFQRIAKEVCIFNGLSTNEFYSQL